RLNLNDNAPLQVTVTLPSQQGGEFVNTLVPALRLFDSSGNLVASGDNTLRYHVPQGAGGTYYLEVLPSPTTPQPTSGDNIRETKQGQPGAARPTTPLLPRSSPAPATSSSTPPAGPAQAAPLAASASAPAPASASAASSTLVASSLLMNLTSTPMVPNG